jgi:cytochrome c oxidase assembly protein subunit 15
LTNSGLSMVEWKLISGSLPPMNAAEWQVMFEKYQQFPEYKLWNKGMSVNDFKSIFWWEYIHRFLGRVVGLVFLIPFLYFYFKKWLSAELTKKLVIIFFLGGFQGFLGWYMVKSGLVDLPHVSHFRLAAHLINSLILISFIIWTLLSIGDKYKRSSNSMWLPYVSIFLLITQIVFGAFVAGLKAGYGYNNFPMMGDTFLPNSDLLNATPAFYNGVLIQFIHRWLAFMVLLVIILLYRSSRKIPLAKKYATLLLIAVSVQVLLGIATLMLSVPISLGVIHQFMAVIIVLLTVTTVFHMKHEPIQVPSS